MKALIIVTDSSTLFEFVPATSRNGGEIVPFRGDSMHGMYREQAGASWLPRPKQASMQPWSGPSPGAAIVEAAALKLEATKLEILKLECLVADRIQIKPGALGATQAQFQWQAAAAAAAAENQTPSSSLPPTAPWQTANNPAAVAAIAAVRAA